MTAELSIFERPVEVPEELERAAREKGWPDGLVRDALELRVSTIDVREWLKDEQLTVEKIRDFLRWREQLISGTIRVREATWGDSEALADLYANAPEDIGDWEVTTERSPYAFAQFRLQEHPNIQVLEDRGVILAASAHASRNALVGGRRTTVHVQSAFRVRKEARGRGYSHLLRMGAGPACAWYGMLSYYYVRGQNFEALDWIRKLNPDIVENAPEREADVPGLSVTVSHLRSRPFTGDMSGICPARRSDVRRCVALINRTHRGLDLFRPYSEEYLLGRLDDPSWGPKPDFIESVYGWPEYRVVEEDGRIVACGGLWDRGKHLREVWRNKTTGEERVIDGAALLDFGYAEGFKDAMATLIGYFLGEAKQLGRAQLMVPLDFLPELAERLAVYEPATESRALHWQVDLQLAAKGLELELTRPYTDLSYW